MRHPNSHPLIAQKNKSHPLHYLKSAEAPPRGHDAPRCCSSSPWCPWPICMRAWACRVTQCVSALAPGHDRGGANPWSTWPAARSRWSLCAIASLVDYRRARTPYM